MTTELIGIDAGASWIKAARFSPALDIVGQVTVPSGADAGATAYFDSIAAAAAQLHATTEPVGLAIPALLSTDATYIRYMANVPGLEVGGTGISLVAALGSRLKTTNLVADNDANCAALGEWRQGRGQGDMQARLLHVTWGTGIGMGFVTNGAAHYGWEGGHLPVTWGVASDGIACNCGSTHDLEAYTAVPHVVERAWRLLQEKTLTTSLAAADFADRRETSKRLLAAAEVGDPLAERVLTDALQWLARGLHIAAIIAYPTLVTVGGGMMASDWLLARLREHVKNEARGFLVDTLKPEIVERAALGNEAGMIGAAALAQQALKVKK